MKYSVTEGMGGGGLQGLYFMIIGTAAFFLTETEKKSLPFKLCQNKAPSSVVLASFQKELVKTNKTLLPRSRSRFVAPLLEQVSV